MMGRTLRVVLAAGLAGVLTLVLALVGPVAADEHDHVGTQLPRVVQVDAETSEVQLSVMTGDFTTTASDISVQESGRSATVTTVERASELGMAIEVVYVIDVGNRNAKDATLGRVGRSVLAQLEGMGDSVSVGVVTAGADSVVRVPLTQSYDRLERSLTDLRAERGSVIYDGVADAARIFTEGDDVARTIVVISGGGDDGSEAAAGPVSSVLVQRGVQLASVSVGHESGLATIAAAAGGAHLAVADNAELLETIEVATAIGSDRLVVGFEGTAAVGERAALEVTMGAKSMELSYPAGVNSSSISQLLALPEPPDGGHPFFSSPTVLYGSILLAFATIAMAIWALGSLFISNESNLDDLLSRYANNEELDEDEVKELLVQSSLVRRAVDITEALAEDRGVLVRVERMLERADLPMRAGEALFFLASGSFLGFLAALLFTRSVLTAIAVSAVVAIAGYFTVQMLARRRLSKFEQQLPDTLNMLSGTLRAGYSLPQGLGAVSEEMADPMGEELRRAMTETQLGREIEDSLSGVAERLDSPDFAWAVMAIGIQREIGGNLNELLLTVADTMVQRQRLRREVNALTAEGRVSAGILSMLPPGLGLVLWVMNPDYVSVLFSNTTGMILLGAGVVSAMVGLIWMKKVITIDA